MTQERSEFGRGYATCLIQFANHRSRLGEHVALYREMHAKHPDSFTEAAGIEIWANGASDHLYELLRPLAVSADDWRSAKALAARVLDIGHGFRNTSPSDPLEAAALLDEADRLLAAIGVATLPDAIAWDHAHGLPEAEEGTWSCAENLRRTLA